MPASTVGEIYSTSTAPLDARVSDHVSTEEGNPEGGDNTEMRKSDQKCKILLFLVPLQCPPAQRISHRSGEHEERTAPEHAPRDI